MRLKKLAAILLCIAMISGSLAGCGKTAASDLSSATDKAQMEVSKDPIGDKFDEIDDSQINYETEFVTGGNTKEDNKKESNKDLLDSLIENQKEKEEKPEADVVPEKNPEDYVDEDGDLKVPFDIAYPDIFNSDAVQYASNTILLKISNTYSEDTVKGLKEAGIGRLESVFGSEESTWYTAYLLKEKKAEEAMSKVRKVDGVITAEYNFKSSTSGTEDLTGNPKYEKDQWIFGNYGIEDARNFLGTNFGTAGGSGNIVVAVIDTGVDYEHEDLKVNMWTNVNEIPDNRYDDDGNGYIDDYYGVNVTKEEWETAGSAMDDNGHGTHVAGIIAAANNHVGIAGLAYNTKIMPIKAGDAFGYFDQSDIAKAIIYAYEHGASVINMSFGSAASSQMVQEALETAFSRCVLVASAGNDSAANEGELSVPNYPAALPYVIGVMSSGKNNVESAFTNYDVTAKNSREYEVYAPGEEIVSTLPGNRYGSYSGTSMAAPVVAAQAALLRSFYADTSKYPTTFIYGQIVSTADHVVTCNGVHGEHNIPGVINFNDALTDIPEPDVTISGYTIFDQSGYEADTEDYNNGDGIIDAGETIALGFSLWNSWGESGGSLIKVEAVDENGETDPYVEIVNPEVQYPAVSAYAENDCGKVYTDDGEMWIGWENPFYLKVAKNCPNNYVLKIKTTVISTNGLNPDDTKEYVSEQMVSLIVRRGLVLTGTIKEDTTLTADNYYIIPNSLKIPADVTVTVEAGTKIQFWCSDPEDAYAQTGMAYLDVAGNFICEGTAENPVEIFPSEWMDHYRVEIKGGAGFVDLKYTKVTNPYISVDNAENCEFTQNGTGELSYRELWDSEIEIYSCDPMVSGGYLIDCAFYHLGSNEYEKVMLNGYAQRCMFYNSNVDYDGVSVMDRCVLYGNGRIHEYNYGEGNSSVSYSAGDLTAKDAPVQILGTFYVDFTGSTYVVIGDDMEPVPSTAVKKLANYLGGDYAVFETRDELSYVLSKARNYANSYNSSSYRNYYIGINEKDGVFYDAKGNEMDLEALELTVKPSQTGYEGYLDYWNTFNLCYTQDRLYNGYGSYIVEIPGEIYVKDIRFEEFVVLMEPGGTYDIDPIVKPSTVEDSDLIFESQNENIVTVDEEGVLTAVGTGTTAVRVYCEDFGVYNYLTVNVKESVPLTSLILESEENVSLAVNELYEMKVSLDPVYTTERNITYESSNESVALVNSKGTIRAFGGGEAVITAYGAGGISASMNVSVYVPAEKVEFADNTMMVDLQSEVEDMVQPVISPAKADNRELVWASSNPEVCYINAEGKLVKLKPGTSEVKAKIKGTELFDTITVIVTAAAMDADLEKVVYSEDLHKMFVLTSDGKLWAWGDTLISPKQVPLEEDVKDFALRGTALFVLDTDGTVRRYDSNLSSATTHVALNNRQIISGLPHGMDRDGQDKDKDQNYIVSLSQESTVPYYRTIYGVDANGDVWSLNDGYNCSLVDFYVDGELVPEKVNVKKVLSVDSGAACLTVDGELYIINYNNDTTSAHKFEGDTEGYEYIRFDDIIDIYHLSRTNFAVQMEGRTVDVWGYGQVQDYFNSTEPGWKFTENDRAYYVNDGELYLAEGYSSHYDHVKVEGLDNIVKVFNGHGDNGRERFFIVTQEGDLTSVYAYGNGEYKLLGTGTTEDAEAPVPIYFGVVENTNPLELTDWTKRINNDQNIEYLPNYDGKPYVFDETMEIVFDFNHALKQSSGFGGIKLVNEDTGIQVAITKLIDLDKLIIRQRGALVDGETYLLTIPSNAFINRVGNYNEYVTYRFTYDVSLEKVTITQGEELTLNIGESEKLGVTYTPDDTSDEGFELVSSNPDVITIGEDGMIHAVGVGIATVTAHGVYEHTEGVTDSIEVTVIVPTESIDFPMDVYEVPLVEEEPEETPDEELPEDGTDGEVPDDDTVVEEEEEIIPEYYPVITPLDATNQEIIWETSDPEVCYFDEELGELVKVSTGIAVLRVSVKGTTLSDTLTVIITDENFQRPESDKLLLESWNGELFKDAYYIYSDTVMTFDFNQILSEGEKLDQITLISSEGTEVSVETSFVWDKMSVAYDGVLTDGEEYTFTIPAGALKGWLGAENEEISYTFTFINLGRRDAIIDEEIVDNRYFWEEDGEYEQYIEDGLNSKFSDNAFLSRLNDEDMDHWLRILGGDDNGGDFVTVISMGGNYWGTTNEEMIENQIMDHDDFESLKDVNQGAFLTEAPEDTYPFVANAILKVDGDTVDTIGNGKVTFIVEFNRDMDVSIPLDVRFGSHYPHADYVVDGEYVLEEGETSSRIWKGEMNLLAIIENGYQYWSIGNGKAADADLKLYTDTGRFMFLIDTTAAQALTMQAEARDEGIYLKWEQDDFDTLAGYNVYRATEKDGYFTKVNTTVIPADTKEWLDTQVEPGMSYYYNFTVVETDMTESEPSGKISATAKDTMAPGIYHTPVYNAFTGSNLVIAATITDNVAIQGATLYYRQSGATDWKALGMTNYNDKYSAVIPASDVTTAGLEYYIEATDGISKTYAASAADPYPIAVQLAVSASEKGDVNDDGMINLLDALLILKHINGQVNLDAEQFVRADLDDNGMLSASEALRILQYVNGKLTTVLP